MSTRALAVLGAIVLALVAYIAAFERGSVTSKELSERKNRVLPSFVRDKVERISVQRHGKEVVLERKRTPDGLGGFVVTSPFASPADDDATDKLLGELEWLSARRSVEDDAQFGLDKPRYRISYRAGGDTHTLTVGNDDVHGQALYVRVDAEPKVHVVPKALLEVIDHEPGYFRDKALYPDLTVAWVNKLSIAGAQRYAFEKHDKHWWLGEASEKRYADDAKLDELLHALSSLRASRDVEPSEQAAAEQALASPTLAIQASVVPDETREDQKARVASLQVAGTCGAHGDERYARVTDGRLACVKASDVAPFELSVAPAEPRLFRAPPNEITRFVVGRGKDQLAWKRDGSKWKSDVDAPADTAAIEGWLEDLSRARVERVQPLAGFNERGTLRLEQVDDRAEELRYGALTSDGELPVRRGDESLVVLFPGSVGDRLTPVRTRFLPLTVWKSHQPSEVVKFEAQVRDKKRSGALVDGRWKTEGDGERIRELVRELVGLEAVAFVSDQPRPEHGLGNGRLVLGLRDGKSLTLELGAATDRGVYARTGDGVLEIDGATLAQIEELAGGPRAPMRNEEDDDDDDPEHEGEAHEHAH